MDILLQSLLPGENYVVQLRARDSNGQTSNWSKIYNIATDTYTIPPSQPSAPIVVGNTLSAQVSHNMSKQAGGQLEKHVDQLEVHASTITGFTPDDTTLIGTISVADVTVSVSGVFYYPSSTSLANLYWKVIAVDRLGNRSIASNQTTGLPGLIQSVNIADATITSAKIQSLESDKIIAGNGIINNLAIKSTLTVADGGVLRSENYVASTTGWMIDSDGAAEFNDVDVRGPVEVIGVSTGLRIRGDVPIPISSFGSAVDFYPVVGGAIDDSSDPVRLMMRTNGSGTFIVGDHLGIISGTDDIAEVTLNKQTGFYLYARQGDASPSLVTEQSIMTDPTNWGLKLEAKGNITSKTNGSVVMQHLTTGGVVSSHVTVGNDITLELLSGATTLAKLATSGNDWNVYRYINAINSSGVVYGWTNLTFANSWANRPGFYAAQARINALREVQLIGTIWNGVTTSGTKIGALPSSLYYPASETRVPCAFSNGAVGSLIVKTNGDILLSHSVTAASTLVLHGSYPLAGPTLTP